MSKQADFGWELPPGVTHKMVDEAMGDTDDAYCECCGQSPPLFECRRCGAKHAPACIYGCEQCEDE